MNSPVVTKRAAACHADERERAIACLVPTLERSGLDHDEARAAAVAVFDRLAADGCEIEFLDGFDCAPEGKA